MIARQADEDTRSLLLEQFDKGHKIVERGAPADSLYLIMGGRVHVTRLEAGGTVLLDYRKVNDFFGESCIEAGTRRTATVEAVSLRVYQIGRETVVEIMGALPAVRDRLRTERDRIAARDREMGAGRLAAPAGPTQEIASKLMLTKNLLLIDMDRCTRCDQCVRGCAEGHEGGPRFTGSIPIRDAIRKWEIAGACLHCSDARARCVPGRGDHSARRRGRANPSQPMHRLQVPGGLSIRRYRYVSASHP